MKDWGSRTSRLLCDKFHLRRPNLHDIRRGLRWQVSIELLHTLLLPRLPSLNHHWSLVRTRYGRYKSRRRWTVCDFDLVSENEGVVWRYLKNCETLEHSTLEPRTKEETYETHYE